jgi:hypothetical protein
MQGRRTERGPVAVRRRGSLSRRGDGHTNPSTPSRLYRGVPRGDGRNKSESRTLPFNKGLALERRDTWSVYAI